MGIVIDDENSEHYFVADPLKEAIYQIILLIKRNKYEEAAAIMAQYELTLEKLVQYTFKLNDIEIARLGDFLISKRG